MTFNFSTIQILFSRQIKVSNPGSLNADAHHCVPGSVPADAHILHGCPHYRRTGGRVGHAAHMCPVHVNNATSCRGLEGSWLSASLHRRREEEEVGAKTDRGTKEGVN